MYARAVWRANPHKLLTNHTLLRGPGGSRVGARNPPDFAAKTTHEAVGHNYSKENQHVKFSDI